MREVNQRETEIDAGHPAQIYSHFSGNHFELEGISLLSPKFIKIKNAFQPAQNLDECAPIH